jgi:hypothetical protein
MKDGLHGQHFSGDTVMAAVLKWVASTDADFYEPINVLKSSLTVSCVNVELKSRILPHVIGCSWVSDHTP